MIDKGNKKVYTKSDIVEKVLERLEKVSKKDVTEVVNETFEVIGEMLMNSNLGDEVKVGNIGVLTTRMTKAGDRRNPKTQEVVHVDAKKVAKFRVLPKFRAELRSK